ncbi:MAG: sulfatase [Kiritimatiellae bacterium]|nr:sulfatase [Kiritimatiellia bacterium]
MRAIMVMYDTLNRRFLEPYGCDWVKTPNFTRLAKRAVTMDNAYGGSLPTIPARRELHTGRYNFLHRRWGPVEPFDDSVPALLHANGVYTHLATDGYHYFEDGGMTFHNRYGSWEFFRGQEGDFWKGEVADPEIPDALQSRGLKNRSWRQDWVNRKYIRNEGDWPQAQSFAAGLQFMRTNRAEDNWWLHIETFDPHEPYYAAQTYRDLYPHDYDGPHFDWPQYRPIKDETPEQIQHIRYECAALHSMCDAHLGKVLDLMDELDMWKDTLLIVNTDHGFLMGEHGRLGKCNMPFYDEIAHTPLFVWDPRCGRKGARCPCLVQTIDLGPTLMEFFGLELTPDMQGRPLREAVAADRPVREAALFGQHGGHVNVTDGRYVFMKAPAKPENEPLYNYTLLPTNMRGYFTADGELKEIELAGPFSFTKGVQVVKFKAGTWRDWHQFGDLLFDLQNDPGQQKPIRDAKVEKRLTALMRQLMKANDCPPEQFERLGLAEPNR